MLSRNRHNNNRLVNDYDNDYSNRINNYYYIVIDHDNYGYKYG